MILKRVVLGFKEGSEPGSNFRRLLARFSFFIIVIVMIWSLDTHDAENQTRLTEVAAIFSVFWSFFFFALVVLAIPFLTSHNFRPDPVRLFIDALVSITLAIASFGFFYSVWGIVPPTGETAAWADYFYFSAVTFSTLGFGDFRPSETTRVPAALEAILGNLHLGVIVGAAFFAATPGPLRHESCNEPNEQKKSNGAAN